MSATQDYKEPSSSIHLPSNRSFGLLLVGVCLAFAAYAVFANWATVAVWLAVTFGAVLFMITIKVAHLLQPLNRAWYRFGLALGKIVSPVVLGAIFFLLLTPIALIGRAAGRDELRLQKRAGGTYWVARSPAGPGPSSFTNQF